MKHHYPCSISTTRLLGGWHGATRSLATLASAAAIGLSFPALQASAADQIVHGQVPAMAANRQPIGRLEATKQLILAIGLPLRDQPGLDLLLQQLYDRASANYHQYLTPAQFTERFGPTEQDYQAVMAFAQAHNLAVTHTHPNRVILDVSGKVADIENAMHVNMLVYQHPTEARTFYAPDVDPSLDLAVPVLGIEGLNNYALPHPNCIATPLANMQNPQPAAGTGSGPNGAYVGYDFRKAYLPGVNNTSLNGKNQVVGLVEFDGYTNTDITAYESLTGLPAVPLNNVLVDGFNGEPYPNLFQGQQEVTLDIDMAIAMAPGLSQVIVYEGSPAEPYPWLDVLNQVADDNLAKQISCSWASAIYPDDEAVAQQIFEQMAAQGQSFLAASGDFDAYTGSILFPDDSPNITVVGGTTLTTGESGSWVSETVWNWDVEYGSGYDRIGSSGGIST